MDNILHTALTQLDQELTKQNLSIEIVICGAYAIHLHGYSRSELTLDIDCITELSSSDVKHLIEVVGQKLGLGPYWLNDQASTVSLPTGVLSRVTPIKYWDSIKASLVSRADLIKMKASAFSIRRDQTNKDWEDLALLKPSTKEMDDAISFLMESNCPPPNASKKILADFEETLNDLKTITKQNK
jgi:hypothetical protein